MSQTRQRFEGTSIETALAAAVAGLGPDLEVSEARRVRSRGLLGFFAREHFEVLAEPKTSERKMSGDTLARAEASLDDTLQSLMARIEAEETPAAFAASLAAAAATPEPVEAPAPAPAQLAAPAPAPAPVAPLRRVRPGEPRWGTDALRDLGLPEGVLARVTVADGAGDQEWTMALAGALATELAAADAAVPDGSVTVTGQGAPAAIALIRAAACGFPPDCLRLPSGDVPATAMELALAVRSCLPR